MTTYTVMLFTRLETKEASKCSIRLQSGWIAGTDGSRP